MMRKISIIALAAVATAASFSSTSAFVLPVVTPSNVVASTTMATSTALNGLFDNFRAGGTGNSKQSLDEEWEKQQAILQQRRKPKAERDAYFEKIEQRRREASTKQDEMWGWQSKSYKKGEDPIDEWKKRRKSGQISDLDDQYGDPKSIGGIPLPMPSFGVGGTVQFCELYQVLVVGCCRIFLLEKSTLSYAMPCSLFLIFSFTQR